jgi:hypothetical protein
LEPLTGATPPDQRETGSLTSLGGSEVGSFATYPFGWGSDSTLAGAVAAVQREVHLFNRYESDGAALGSVGGLGLGQRPSHNERPPD